MFLLLRGLQIHEGQLKSILPDNTRLRIRSAPGAVTMAATGLSAVTSEPSEKSDTPLVAISGQINNLPAVCAEAGLESRAFHNPADAIAKLYGLGGTCRLAGLQGSYSICLYDKNTRDIHLIRDRLGGRSAYYLQRAGVTAAASHAHLLGAFTARPFEEDPDYFLTRLLYAGFPSTGRTPFADISEALPGEHIRFSESNSESSRNPIAIPAEFSRQTASAATHTLRALLENATAQAIEPHTRIASMLSGGLDSAPATALTNQLLGNRRSLFAVSWALEGHGEADEAGWIRKLAEHIGLPLVLFDGNEHLPFSDLSSSYNNPGYQEYNPFRPLLDQCMAIARQQEAGAIMNCTAGDFLYPRLAMLPEFRIAQGQWSLVARILKRESFSLLLNKGKASKAPHIRAWARLLKRRLFGDRPSRYRRNLLSAQRAQRLPASPRGFLEDIPHPVPAYARFMLESAMPYHRNHESYFAECRSLQLIDPYQDENLAAFFLAIPFDYAYRHKKTKWIMREASKDLIPTEVNTKKRTGKLLNVLRLGFQRARLPVTELIYSESQAWQDTLDESRLSALLQKEIPSEADLVLIAQVIGYCLWRRNIRELRDNTRS